VGKNHVVQAGIKAQVSLADMLGTIKIKEVPVGEAIKAVLSVVNLDIIGDMTFMVRLSPINRSLLALRRHALLLLHTAAFSVETFIEHNPQLNPHTDELRPRHVGRVFLWLNQNRPWAQ